MCGILLLCSCARSRGKECPKAQAHRGPDDYRTGVFRGKPYRFDRLQVTGDAVKGMQPAPDAPFLLANAEVYSASKPIGSFSLQSDCAKLLELVSTAPPGEVGSALAQLTAEFAMVWQGDGGETHAARDHYGVRPLYSATCSLCHDRAFASELLPLAQFPEYGGTADQLRPGVVSQNLVSVPMPRAPKLHLDVAHAFACAVGARMTNCEHTSEIGVLLSGGLDSTAVAYIMSISQLKGRPPIRAFTFYHDSKSQDLKCARKVAAAIDIPLEEIHVQPTLEDVRRCIRVIGSYDTTTVRASTMQMLAFQQIRERFPAIKVVLCGEGADELLGGYQYFLATPSPAEAEAESIRLMSEIHRYDGLRVDRTAAAYGFEVRLPFLDAQFVETVRAAAPATERFAKSMLTKSWFRSKLAMGLCNIPEPVLEVIIGRSKAALSDAVGGTWIDTLKIMIARRTGSSETPPPYSDGPTPVTAEEQFYLRCFRDAFPLVQRSPIKHYWMPKWQPGATDPSATTWACYSS